MNDLVDFSDPCPDCVGAFMVALEQTRASNPFSTWQSFVRTSPVIRSWRFFLSLDPYTRWGLVKPRGYPGDATLMDFAYGHDSIRAHVAEAGSIGQRIYAETSNAKQSRSARERIERLRQEIQSQAKCSRLKVISVASGHARELEGIDADSRSKFDQFTALDLDPVSLQEAQRSAADITFEGIRVNVIKDEFQNNASQGNLVYSLGLFDYLSDAHADDVLRKMLSLTKPGGRCIVANLAPNAGNLGYCEAIMDWWMTTREKSDMQSLGDRAKATVKNSLSTNVQQLGCFNYLTIDLS